MNMSKEYWFSKYIYSGIVTWLASYIFAYEPLFQRLSHLGISFLCFPLALYLWDSIFNISPSFVIMPIQFILVWKILKNFFLYVLSPVIVPVVLIIFFFQYVEKINKSTRK
jgi:hypothetical protein